jgi:molybdopterin converting factor small subunit
MPINVRLPAMLGGEVVAITERVETLDQLVAALGRARPDVTGQLHDAIFNFAVNDEMLLHDVLRHPLKDGDVVEIVPAISGG